MEMQHDSLYCSLRSKLPPGFGTADEFFGPDDSETKEKLKGLVILLLQFLCQFLGGPVSISDGNKPIDLLPRIKDYYDTGKFGRFWPLIDLLLTGEAKSDQDMLEFLDKAFSTTPSYPSLTPKSTFTTSRSHPSSASAPVRTIASSGHVNSSSKISDRSHPSSASAPVETNTLSGHVNSSSKVSDLIPVLKQELKNLMHKDVPGLLDHLFKLHDESASLLKVHTDPTSLLSLHESFIQQTYEQALADTSETAVLSWITPLLKRISSSLESKIPAQHSRTWQSELKKRLRGVEQTRMLDSAIMSHYHKEEYHISDILVPVKLKTGKQNVSRAAVDLAKYVCEVFKAQPYRSYVVGLTLCGTDMMLWQFDRCGAIGSESLDIKNSKEDFRKFLKLIVIFLTSNKRVLGFDPTFDDTDGQASISTQLGSHKFVIDRPIFRASGIYGRGTTCWEAHLFGDKDAKFLIKDSWQPAHRTAEGDMLYKAAQRNVNHVARYYYHEDVTWPAGKSTLNLTFGRASISKPAHGCNSLTSPMNHERQMSLPIESKDG
ncbi:hypothetical protein PTTG_06309 [Puccinia triticina 1-1 BBBD Race 1]|uniref:Pkinase_fungal domain-containing protein n=1 Tax=Puccinia triticina (isolate 1-1 / race 1 (BBBD)) TaxID=630390 RepID=A0A180GVB5_PUCT1|nr:hypothetical protein PTTG_06309 [Puccinia triticina 1-1 BBBD Race 1]